MFASLAEIGAVFLKLGLVAFGGPAAHVALMRREVVTRRAWLPESAFLEDFAACQLIPGPTSTELAVLLGYGRAGVPGLLVAGASFVSPATVIMLLLAAVYSRFASSPLIAAALHGIRPVVVGIIGWALIDLGRRIVRGPLAALIGLAVAAASLLGANPILLLIAGGVAAMLWQWRPPAQAPHLMLAVPTAVNTSIGGIFLAFLKFGALSFGSGYVLFAFLRSDVVDGYHWLTNQQLADALAISQATPGPVFTVATFIGYLVAGLPGGLVATFAIFLPGFLLVPLLGRLVAFVRGRRWAASFLEGVNIAALGLIAAVALLLGRVAVDGPLTAAIALVALLVLLRLPLAAPALVIAGAALGLLGGLRF